MPGPVLSVLFALVTAPMTESTFRRPNGAPVIESASIQRHTLSDTTKADFNGKKFWGSECKKNKQCKQATGDPTITCRHGESSITKQCLREKASQTGTCRQANECRGDGMKCAGDNCVKQ